jgi:hypothetical protein
MMPPAMSQAKEPSFSPSFCEGAGTVVETGGGGAGGGGGSGFDFLAAVSMRRGAGMSDLGSPIQRAITLFA